MSIETIKQDLLESATLVHSIANSTVLLRRIESLARTCVSCLSAGGKVLFAGNGGSAGDAQHMAGEFVSRFNYDRPGMAAIALTVDSSILTAIGNDYGYDYVFARQVEALGQRGDLFFAYSTSGNSPNILRALRVCKDRGLISVGLTGNRVGAMNALCDVLFEMPSARTPRIQEGHLIIGHAICARVEALMYPREP